MLILSRKINETIMIGDHIQIELVMIDQNRALIGIRAPKDVQVHRQEIYDRNQMLLNIIKVKRSKQFIKEIVANVNSQ